MAKYEKLDIQSRGENPLERWTYKQIKLPNLRLLANIFLSTPPSQVKTERLFSMGGNICTPHRNRLTSDTGEMRMFLKT